MWHRINTVDQYGGSGGRAGRPLIILSCKKLACSQQSNKRCVFWFQLAGFPKISRGRSFQIFYWSKSLQNHTENTQLQVKAFRTLFQQNVRTCESTQRAVNCSLSVFTVKYNVLINTRLPTHLWLYNILLLYIFIYIFNIELIQTKLHCWVF